MMWLTVRCTEEISVSALAKLASAITDAAHRETGVSIGDIRVEFRSYIPDSTYYRFSSNRDTPAAQGRRRVSAYSEDRRRLTL